MIRRRVTFNDIAQPYDKMSWQAKRAFMKCLKKSCKDQNKLLRRAKNATENLVDHNSLQ